MSAFSEEEQAYILESVLENPGNPDYGIPDQNTTNDRVFLPCLREIYDGVVPKEYVKAYATEYAKEKGVEVRGQDYCMWWLRCCSVDNDNVYWNGEVFAAAADDLGKAFAKVRITTLPSVGVRPMIRVGIKNSRREGK